MKHKKVSTETQIIAALFMVISGIFKGIWWLVSLPFKNKQRIKTYNNKHLAVNVDVQVKWGEIQEMVNAGGASRLKSAVIEADKLLDNALRGRGYKGESTGEMLKLSKNIFSYQVYNGVWDAHKLRNRLVHELDVDVLHFEVKEAIRKFESALRELGAM